MTFHVVRKNDAQIHVMHAEGHEYTFTVAETDDGVRHLGEPLIHESGYGKHSGAHFSAEARRFAENEARTSKLID